MRGFWVLVGVGRDDDTIGHEMFAVAADDPDDAIEIALKAANGFGAVLSGEIDRASMERLGLKEGEFLKALDEHCDPLISQARRY